MIYACRDGKCGYVAETEAQMQRCPECGGRMEPIAEKEMSAVKWSQLGYYWAGRDDADRNRIYECFRRAAYMGDLWGINNLGWCLENGVGTDKDEKTAAWLYRQAAEQGYTPAVCNYGYCLQNGIGVREDWKKAVEQFRQ